MAKHTKPKNDGETRVAKPQEKKLVKHIKVGEPENDAEIWAAKYLSEKLPEDYLILSNVYIQYEGNNHEIDLIVIAPYVIHFIDVKGYKGRVRAGQGQWTLPEGTFIDPVDKVTKHTKKYPTTWRNQYPDEKAPWLKGCVFVTGVQGKNLELVKSGQDYPAYGPEDIIDYLKYALYQADHNRVDTMQRERFLRLLNIVSGVKPPASLAGFKLVNSRIELGEGVYAQYADSSFLSLTQRYLLKVVELNKASKSVRKQVEELWKRELRIVRALEGVNGIPQCLQPIRDIDGQRLIFPVQHYEKTSLEALQENNDVTCERFGHIFKRVIEILQECHDRNVYHGCLSLKRIAQLDDMSVQIDGFFGYCLTKEGSDEKLEVLDNGVVGDIQRCAILAAELFCSTKFNTFIELSASYKKLVWPSDLELPIKDWLEELVEEGEYSFDKLFEGVQEKAVTEVDSSVAAEFQMEEGAIVNKLYRLERKLGSGTSGIVWEATHLLGDFRCCAKIMTLPREGFKHAQNEYKTLVELFHPNIVRLYSFIPVDNSDYYCLITAMGDKSLEEVIQEDSKNAFSGKLAFSWFSGLLSALEYLRKPEVKVIHQDIKPGNIVVTGDHASLIDFNLSNEECCEVGTLRYKKPDIASSIFGQPWSHDADLYSLCLTFYEVLFGYPFNDDLPEYTKLKPKVGNDFPIKTIEAICKVLSGSFPVAEQELKEFFHLNRFSFSLEKPLPESLVKKWALTHKDQEYILATLIKNGGQMSRNQLQHQTLKWRNISRSVRNLNGINARLAPLRNMGLIDYPRNVQGGRVQIKWMDCVKEDWGIV